MIHLSRISTFLLYACLLCVFFSSCSDKDKVPSDVLDRPEMSKVIWDMIQADRYAGQFLLHDSAKDVKTETFKLYEEVFKLHKVSREDFIHSYKFYLSRPDISRVMFDSLSARATRERADMYKVDSAKNKAGQPVPVETAVQPATPTAFPVPIPYLNVDSLKKAGVSKSAIRKMQRLRKVDSFKRVDSLKKIEVKRTDSLKKADALKKANALKNVSTLKSADSVRNKGMLRYNRGKRPFLPLNRDSAIKRQTPVQPIP